MNPRTSALVAVSLLPLIFAAARLARAQAQSAGISQHSQVVDESSRVVLKGNRHPLAIPANDQGEVQSGLPMERMLLVLRRNADQEERLQRLIAEQQDKSSANFHAWLSPEQFAERFAPSQSGRQLATAWLESHGFRINRIARGGTLVEFAGTAGQVKEAFGAAIHQYAVKGRTHYANAEEPTIPTALASTIAGVSTLHNFEKHPELQVLGKVNRVGNTSTWQPNLTFHGATGTAHYLAPGDFATIYSTLSLYGNGLDGAGQAIAIVGRSNINLSDIQIFRLAFGLPTNDPMVVVDGPDPGNLFNGDETEADLDVEWSGAIAPKATIKFVVSATTNSTDGVDLSAQYIVDNNLAPIISVSFGQCESAMGATETAFYNNLWEQASAQGITVLVSSGDNGPAGCDDPNFVPATRGVAVNGLASTPFNIAVGGTQFNENGNDSKYWAVANGANQASALGYIPEIVWNESCGDPSQCLFPSLFASAGGASSLYSKPSWQAGPGVPNDGKRDLPGVSLSAAGRHDGYLICQDGICLTDSGGQLISAFVVGGTSASTPTFAAIMSLVLQKTNARQGQANFVLYPLAAGENTTACNSSAGNQSQCVFNDISQGNNNVPGLTGFAAGPGYDLATGLGSVNALSLVNSWQNVIVRSTNTTLTISPATSIVHGQPLMASATVASMTGTGTPTGGVALVTGGSGDVLLGSLVNGSVSAPISTLPGGTYSVSASYGGDGTFAPSASAGVPVTIAPESSTTSFATFGTTFGRVLGLRGTIPATSTTYSNPLYLQAAVAGASNQGIATGTISFLDTPSSGTTTTTLTSVLLNSQGSVFVPEATLAVGMHNLRASYSGDASFAPSSSGSVTVTVTPGITQTILLAPPGILPNTSVFLEAEVIPTGVAQPTGTVQFFSGASALGSAQVQGFLGASVIARLNTTLPNGPNSITATYSGDANFGGSTSPARVVYVGNPDFQIAVNPGDVTVTSSTPGTSTVFVTPGPGLPFTGNISFTCSGLPAGAACSFSPSTLNLQPVIPNPNNAMQLTTTLTITKGSAQAAAPNFLRNNSIRMWTAGMDAIGLVLLLCWPTKTRRRRAGMMALSTCVLLAVIGCSGGTSGSTVPASTPASASGVSVVTVTATGSNGFAGNSATITHSVTLAVTMQ